MKPLILLYAGGVIFMWTALYSCESRQQKLQDAQQNLQDAKRDLHDAQSELNQEYPAFRAEEEREIAANENRIADLRRKISAGGVGKPLDPDRADRIARLEERNAELKSRLDAYEHNHGDWESFKRDFKRDMDEFGNSVRNLGKDSIR